LPVDETSTINLRVNGPSGPNEIRGIWVNKDECLNWRGPIPLDQYKINLNTADATVIRKQATHSYDQVQNISVKYLKPPRPTPPGDLIIREEPNVQLPPAPPIIIRQQVNIFISDTVAFRFKYFDVFFKGGSPSSATSKTIP
jgi:hypothetical protein